MRSPLARLLWIAGMPVRAALVWLIKGYRASLGQIMGGRCRFYPSCSEYAEAVLTQVGVVRGLALAVWRVLRCSPLSKGGIDYPPAGRAPGTRLNRPGEAESGSLYDSDIQGGRPAASPSVVGGGPR